MTSREIVVPAGFSKGDHISASQLKTAYSCEARWWFPRVGGLPKEPDTDATRLGGEVHAAVEDWLLNERYPDVDTRAGRIATALLHYAPHPGTPGMEVEKQIDYITPGGAWITGFVDLMTDFGANVIDWKTSSNLKYAVVLRDDIQANIYAIATGAKSLRWAYVQTKTYGTEVRDWTPGGRYPLEKSIDVAATRLVQCRKLPLEQIQKNFTHCNAYGRPCPYTNECNAKGPSNMSLSSFLSARKAAAAAAAKAPEAAKPTAPEPVVSADEDTAMDLEADVKAALAQHAAKVAQSIDVTTPLVAPKHSTPEVFAEEELPAPPPKTKTRAKRPAPAPEPLELTLVFEPEPTPAPAPEPTPAPEPKPSTPGGLTSRTLFVCCAPMGGSYAAFSEIRAAAHRTLAKELGVPHYSLIDYGKGKAAFVSAFEQLLALTPDDGDIVVESLCEDFTLVEPLLVASAGRVVRALR